MTLKFITSYEEALKRLHEDVKADSVKCYDVDNIHMTSLSGFYPQAYLKKCTSVTVAISGDNTSKRDWMVICPYRVDETGMFGNKAYDIDPFIITLDQNTSAPALTGIVAYHQDFERRTDPIAGYETLSKESTVEALRKGIVTDTKPISAAPEPVLNALHHMAGVFKNRLG